MSVLLFLDESGHDHKHAPYEVRGGVALDTRRLWPFVREMKALEVACFGDALHRFGKEIKGHKLLDKDRFKWASQGPRMDDSERRGHCLSFLGKGIQKGPTRTAPTRPEFTAYGQACLEMTRGIFELLRSHGAKLFAAITSSAEEPPASRELEDYLRKDFVYLFERYFFYLESLDESGLLVVDETEKTADRGFVRSLERYFTHTRTGRERSRRIVPSPFFVSSDMSYPVQAADVCIYCINHVFRLPERGMTKPVRKEIGDEIGDALRELEFHGDGYKAGQSFRTHGFVYIPDLYMSKEK